MSEGEANTGSGALAPRRHPVARLIRTPWASLALVVALAGWFQNLPHDAGLREVAFPFRGVRCYFKQYTYILRQSAADGSTSLEIVDENQESWDRLAQLQQSRRDNLVVVSAWRSPIRRSIAYPVVMDYQYEEAWFGTPFPQPDADKVGDVFADYIGATGHPDLARRIRTGTTRWTNPIGYILNAGGLLLFGTFFWSLGWIFSIRAGRRRRQRQRGLCGACAYDLSATSATDMGKKCPECGETSPC